MDHLGYGREIGLRFGLVNVAGYVLLRSDGTATREIFENFEIAAMVNGGSEISIAGAIEKMLKAVCEAAGETRVS
jgi:hypothetical protein